MRAFPPKPTPQAIANARALRQRMTPTERVLWNGLRNHQLDELKFRRQRPIGPYVVDFSCIESHLIIELDGAVHDTQIEYDHDRDEYLQAHGFHILRFHNEEVLADLGIVMQRIREEALTPDPSPMRGRGEVTT